MRDRGYRPWAKANTPVVHRTAGADEIAAFALTLASAEFPYINSGVTVISGAMVIGGGKTAHAG